MSQPKNEPQKSQTMSKEDASRIQSSQAQAGHDTGKDTFASRAQSAGDKNKNAKSSEGGNQQQ